MTSSNTILLHLSGGTPSWLSIVIPVIATLLGGILGVVGTMKVTNRQLKAQAIENDKAAERARDLAVATHQRDLEAQLSRWQRERIEQAFASFLAAGEACRVAQVDVLHERKGQEALEETMRALAAARPLVRITASDLSLVAVREYMEAVAKVNDALVRQVPRQEVDTAFEEQATTLGMVEIMARREAGLADIVYEGLPVGDGGEDPES